MPALTKCRHSVRVCLSLLFVCSVLLSCTKDDDEPVTSGIPQQYDFTLSIGKSNTVTRMADDVVQAEGQSFRGLQSLMVIPFRTANGGSVTINDIPLITTATGNETERVTDQNYYYFGKCFLTQGTNRVLVYGQAAPVTNKNTDSQNGKLETTLVERMLLPGMTFNLKPIQNTFVVHPDAQALANYMTAIANTEVENVAAPNNKWSTTSNSELKALYLDFIHAGSDGAGMMAGSAAHVKAFAAALREQIEAFMQQNIETALCTAILANIDNTSIQYNKYPASFTQNDSIKSLPDGAAVLRWTGSSFSVRTRATTLDNINGINRYTYPAELWYYANSPIKTSNEQVAKSTYESASSWTDLLDNYYKGNSFVGSNTQSVAVEAPLQYGVARLKMTLNAIPATLKDAKDDDVTEVSATTLPLKGVIIGGQHNVGFDFKPLGDAQSDVDACFIYDPMVGTADNAGKTTVNTLALQSYDNEKVPIVLEFENKTGKKFTGKDGIVYPDTKFYLIGIIDPAGKDSGKQYGNRVFTQDYTTEVSMTVSSLAQAYSCMPDLLEPRLEIGVEVQTQWIQPTTTIVKL